MICKCYVFQITHILNFHRVSDPQSYDPICCWSLRVQFTPSHLCFRGMYVANIGIDDLPWRIYCAISWPITCVTLCFVSLFRLVADLRVIDPLCGWGPHETVSPCVETFHTFSCGSWLACIHILYNHICLAYRQHCTRRDVNFTKCRSIGINKIFYPNLYRMHIYRAKAQGITAKSRQCPDMETFSALLDHCEVGVGWGWWSIGHQ